ncbi:hypothetical protein EVAR_78294_1 [Eumeta japonica]|uniref:Uncharacterized protein n=1 Tax=Eumeta variegata TaxID=151549 RepID=A0A4C1T646_EUMVA|nr:hypothetical protein EVAR_78294_1 [Eumeta japonica]
MAVACKPEPAESPPKKARADEPAYALYLEPYALQYCALSAFRPWGKGREPSLQHPERVVRAADDARYERDYQPNVALRPQPPSTPPPDHVTSSTSPHRGSAPAAPPPPPAAQHLVLLETEARLAERARRLDEREADLLRRERRLREREAELARRERAVAARTSESPPALAPVSATTLAPVTPTSTSISTSGTCEVPIDARNSPGGTLLEIVTPKIEPESETEQEAEAPKEAADGDARAETGPAPRAEGGPEPPPC